VNPFPIPDHGGEQIPPFQRVAGSGPVHIRQVNKKSTVFDIYWPDTGSSIVLFAWFNKFIYGPPETPADTRSSPDKNRNQDPGGYGSRVME
jgi:hypothetical protein